MSALKEQFNKAIFFNIKNSKFLINEIFISKLIIFKIEKNFNKKIGPLKLQKLLWFFYIFFYKENKYSFFENDFEAWTYGPVNYKVWKYFNISMLSLKYTEISNIVEITENEKKFFKIIKNDLNDKDKLIWNLINQVLDKTLNIKMKYDSFELYKQTHKQKIWKDAWQDTLKENENRKKLKVNTKNIESIYNECFSW